jgi:putative SOS response-associated peptidase YedK
MCGRYSLAPGEFSELKIQFQLSSVPEFAPRYNIAPTSAPGYEVPIVRARMVPPPGGSAPLPIVGEEERQAVLARWWFIPGWWQKPLSELPTAFNATSEGVAKKPFFREAFKTRRCLVPTTGWREFSGEPGKKQGYQFHVGGKLFAFAGIYDEWVSPDGEVVDSFTIVTQDANEIVRPFHHRMPVIVPPDWYEPWLNPLKDASVVLSELLAKPVTGLEFYATSSVGNSTRAEGPETISKVEPMPLKKKPVQGSLF